MRGRGRDAFVSKLPGAWAEEWSARSSMGPLWQRRLASLSNPPPPSAEDDALSPPCLCHSLLSDFCRGDDRRLRQGKLLSVISLANPHAIVFASLRCLLSFSGICIRCRHGHDRDDRSRRPVFPEIVYRYGKCISSSCMQPRTYGSPKMCRIC